MKKERLILSLCFLFLFFGHSQNTQPLPASQKEALIGILKKYTSLGIPGLAISVHSPETGTWSHAEGYANVEKKIPLTTKHVHYLQSVSKTYMAVALLKLYEAGRLDLDAPYTTYLSDPVLASIPGSEKVTVRMLLNHTSGLPEYSTNPEIVSRIMQDPLTVLDVPTLLSCLRNTSLEFEPGTKYRYRNTNYAVLSLIGDAITGDHVAFINREILDKLSLKNTWYLTKDNYRSDIPLADSYWDVLLEERPANISKFQKANVASMKGDDGLVCSTEDAVTFLKALVAGDLLKPETVTLMQEWVKNEAGEPRYGLGLTYYNLDVTYAIGHSGGGIGAGCVLLYLPEMQATVFLATNYNTMLESPIRKKAENLQMEVLTALFAQ